jgi:hypothetical protein
VDTDELQRCIGVRRCEQIQQLLRGCADQHGAWGCLGIVHLHHVDVPTTFMMARPRDTTAHLLRYIVQHVEQDVRVINLKLDRHQHNGLVLHAP